MRKPIILGFLAAVLFPQLALAAGPALGAAAVDNVVQQYQSAIAPMVNGLATDALYVFGVLAVIEVVYAGIQLVFGGQDFGDFVVELVQQSLMIGFFLFFLINNNFYTIANLFISSLRDAAQNATGAQSIQGDNLFAYGLTIAEHIFAAMSIFKPNVDAALALVGIVFIAVIALITALMVMVVIEAKFAAVAGIIFLGFGASRWTRDIALQVFRYILSVATKLFVMQLIVTVGVNIIQSYTPNSFPNFDSILPLLGVALIFVALVFELPGYAAGLISGSNSSTGSGVLRAAKMAAVAAAAAATGGVGASLAAREAISAGSAMAEATGGSPMGNAARLFASSARQDVVNRLGGDINSRGGSMGGRMARIIRSSSTPKPPPEPPSSNIS